MVSEPQVGIFWFIAAAETVHLLTRGCPLSSAEHYGDCLTFSEGHYETWTAWQRRTLLLPIKALRGTVSTTEYENWPRGRIVYEKPAAQFLIYADKQLLGTARLALIRAAFGLPDRTAAVGDVHYSRANRLPSSTAG